MANVADRAANVADRNANVGAEACEAGTANRPVSAAAG
jgi:hypothetical protein